MSVRARGVQGKLWVLAAGAALGLGACHPGEAPPMPPPKPTNPTNSAYDELHERAALLEATRWAAGEPLDASIVLDGSVGWDAAGFELDTGAGAQALRANAPP